MSPPRRHATQSVSGSALVLLLLVTVLLTTIVISFLTTSRIEQIATRNFSRQNAAAGFAEMATQLAMGKIQQGFTIDGNGTRTTVITTQPGAIRKFVFSEGNITSNSTTELFSGTGNASANGSVNLNNLQSPSSNSIATSNQWTITGNAGESILVPFEDVTITENGTNRIVGRLAYYVDDEGTKLNLNHTAGNRTTLNVASSRSMSLISIANATQADAFNQVINGNATGSGYATSDIKNWGYFFRPEQIGGVVSGFDPNTLPLLSAAPAGEADYHTKKTPWSTDRIFINDLPIDPTGVDAIYESLSGKNATTGNYSTSPNQYELIGQKLRDIHGTTFAEKYTDAGLKQIAANILQARAPDLLNDWNKSFSYNGSLLGATDLAMVALRENVEEDNLDEVEDPGDNAGELDKIPCCAAVKQVIPQEYLGNVPYPILNEIGVTVTFGCNRPQQNLQFIHLQIRPFVSIFNPFQVTFPEAVVGNLQIEMQIDSITYDMEHRIGNGPILGPFTYGPKGYKNKDAFGHTFAEGVENARLRKAGKLGGQLDEGYTLGWGYFSYTLSGNSTFSKGTFYTTSYKKELKAGEELQFPCPPFHNQASDFGYVGGVQFQVPGGSNLKIVDIRNIIIKFEYIRLVAIAGDNTTIRDWVLAQDLEVKGWLQAPLTRFNGQPVYWSKGFPDNLWNGSLKGIRPLVRREDTKPPKFSIKRLDGRLKTSANLAEKLEALCPCG